MHASFNSEPTVQWLETEYNARAAIPDHADIFSRWARTSALLRQQLPGQFDIAFGNTPGQSLDVISAGSDAPVMIFIHGGYWRSLDKSDFTFVAAPYIERGISVALLNYDLAPATPMEDIVRQILKGVEWLYRFAEPLQINRDHFVITGHSAGAHLAAMCVAADWVTWAEDLPVNLIKGLVGISGIYDLTPLVAAPFIQKDLQLSIERARDLSPAFMLPQNPIPMLLAAGALESSEFQRQTRLLGHHWQQHGAHHTLIHGRHHLDVCDAMADPADPIFQAVMSVIESSGES